MLIFQENVKQKAHFCIRICRLRFKIVIVYFTICAPLLWHFALFAVNCTSYLITRFTLQHILSIGLTLIYLESSTLFFILMYNWFQTWISAIKVVTFVWTCFAPLCMNLVWNLSYGYLPVRNVVELDRNATLMRRPLNSFYHRTT